MYYYDYQSKRTHSHLLQLVLFARLSARAHSPFLHFCWQSSGETAFLSPAGWEASGGPKEMGITGQIYH